MERLRLVPLDDTVVFPSMTATLPLDVGNDHRVFLVPRHGGDYAAVGVVAEVVDRVRLPGGGRAVVLSGLHRGVAGAARNDPAGHLVVEVEAKPDETPPRSRTGELEREYRAVVLEILELRGDDGRVAAFLRSITEPGALADTSGYSPDLSFAQKVELLETLSVVERLKLALRLQRERLAELQVRKRIRDDAESGAQKQQRDYILRRQLDSIRKELGEDETSVADEYRKKIADAGMPDAVREQAERELGRLERMGESSPESSMIRSYLDWLLAVPWAKRSEERLDPVHAREVLDADHAGLNDVKERITEYLAVRKLRAERGLTDDPLPELNESKMEARKVDGVEARHALLKLVPKMLNVFLVQRLSYRLIVMVVLSASIASRSCSKDCLTCRSAIRTLFLWSSSRMFALQPRQMSTSRRRICLIVAWLRNEQRGHGKPMG